MVLLITPCAWTWISDTIPAGEFFMGWEEAPRATERTFSTSAKVSLHLKMPITSTIYRLLANREGIHKYPAFPIGVLLELKPDHIRLLRRRATAYSERLIQM